MMFNVLIIIILLDEVYIGVPLFFILSITLLFTYSKKQLVIYEDKVLVKTGLGWVKDLIYRNEITAWSERIIEAKPVVTFELSLKAGSEILSIVEMDYTNYDQIRDVLTEGVPYSEELEKSIVKKEKHIGGHALIAVSLFGILCASIFYFTLEEDRADGQGFRNRITFILSLLSLVCLTIGSFIINKETKQTDV